MKILVVRTDRLGDVMLTLPMAAAIKQKLPGSEVAFVVREYTAPIVRRTEDVDHVLIANSPSFFPLLRIFRTSDAQAVFFPNARPASAFAAFFARIPIRVGTGYRWYSFLYNRKIFDHRKSAEHHEAEYNLRMLKAIGIEASSSVKSKVKLDEQEVRSAREWCLQKLGGAPFVVLHLVSGGSTIEWSEDNWVELAVELRKAYGLRIVLTGTAGDRERLITVSQRIQKAGTDVELYVGHPLADLAALLSLASLVVTIGTGPGHLAATLGTPSVGLFPLIRAISKDRWGFRGKKVVNVTPTAKSECPNCAPCTCMERIGVAQVLEASRSLLTAR